MTTIMPQLQFKIVTPERTVYEDTIDSASIPTLQGEITILPHHIPLVTLLSAGVLTVRKNKEFFPMAVSSGVVEVTGTHIVILADTAERADELEEEKIEEAKKAAQQLMEEKRHDTEGFAEATAGLEREIARLKVARLRRARRSVPGSSLPGSVGGN